MCISYVYIACCFLSRSLKCSDGDDDELAFLRPSCLLLVRDVQKKERTNVNRDLTLLTL